MNKMVYVDPALLNGKLLRFAFFVREFNDSWILQSDSPETKNVDNYETISLEKALQMYPDLDALFSLDLKHNAVFKKGITSGKWYDFK